MARFLVSGKAELAAAVAAALRAEGAEAVEVSDVTSLPQVCAAAGPHAFDGYVQLPAKFTVEGDSAVERVRHYISGGVLARFTAVAAVLPSLVPNARITFVTGALPPRSPRRTKSRPAGPWCASSATPRGRTHRTGCGSTC